MPVLDVRVLSHGASLVLLPESATIRITAVDADGPRKRLEGADFVFARTAVIEVRDGKPVRDIDLRPTDGTFCYEVRITSTVGGFKLTRHITVPDAPGPIRLGDRPNVDPKTFQPTDDIVAAWEGAVSDAVTARDGAVSARVAADAAATTASSAATAATAAKTSATASASAAATSASDAASAAVLAGSAATAAGASATAADTAAHAASTSAAAALQSKTDAGTSATAAEASRVTAGEHATAAAGFAGEAEGFASTASSDRTAAAASATAASTSAGAAAASATAASGSATTAGQRAADASTSATAAAGSATDAATARTGAVTARTATETARDEAVTARTGAETAKTAAETAQTGATAARTGSESARDLAQQYRDQALAGQFAGAVIPPGSNLDTYKTPGRYRVADSANTTGLPFAGFLGPVDVLPRDGNVRQVQVAYRQTGSAATDARGIYLRANNGDGTTWNSWRMVPTQTVSFTAGIPGVALALYDDLNARDQSIMPINIALGTADLDSIALPGEYYQSDGNSGTTARKYPIAGFIGVVSVRTTTNTVLQTAVNTRNDSSAVQGSWQRRRVNSTGVWSAWSFLPTIRFDESVGRRAMAWDVINGREQMVHGDTGWRDISALLITGWSGTLRIRRVGWHVSIRGVIARASSGSASDHFVPLIAGFKAANAEDYGISIQALVNPPLGRDISTDNTNLYVRGAPTSTSWRIFSDYDVIEAWPTALPGTALGAIPAA